MQYERLHHYSMVSTCSAHPSISRTESGGAADKQTMICHSCNAFQSWGYEPLTELWTRRYVEYLPVVWPGSWCSYWVCSQHSPHLHPGEFSPSLCQWVQRSCWSPAGLPVVHCSAGSSSKPLSSGLYPWLLWNTVIWVYCRRFLEKDKSKIIADWSLHNTIKWIF